MIAVTNHIAHDTAVEKVEYRTQIEFLRLLPFAVLELGHIRNPFLIRTFRMEVSCQYVFCCVLWTGSMARTAVARMLNRGLYLLLAHQTQHALIADMLPVVPG